MHDRMHAPARCRRHGPAFGLLAILAASAWAAPAEQPVADGDSLIDLSLDQLVNVAITSVSKKSQRLSEAPAAIFVISSDDIRRSGVTSIPEALRLAPGVEVARIDSNKWAITARGFNGRFANKLLVLMDGRSIYSPLFSGVLWDQHDTMLDDIDRIEVIRGPGATLWGANAVNGVINIITKRAQDTQGGLLSVTAGSEERANVGFRQGGMTQQGTAWRVYGKAFERDAAVDAAGNRGTDDWRMGRTGFRVDGKPYGGTSFTIQGDVFKGFLGETLSLPTLVPPYSLTETRDAKTRGGNLLGRLTRVTEEGEMTLQGYYDGTRIEGMVLEESRDTLDLDFQHRLPLGMMHDVIWGLGYRISRDRTRGGIASMEPPSRTDRLFSAFVQDEIALGERFKLTFGSKLEHNAYTGWEIQPSVRALWKPASGQTAWASISRAVRTPSRGDAHARIEVLVVPTQLGIPMLVQASGGEDMDAERLVAYEAGWRLNPTPSVAFDLAAFFNDYDRLRSQELGTPVLQPLAPIPHLVQPINVGNLLKGHTYGLEAVLEARPLENWRLVAGYSNVYLDLEARSGSTDTVSSEQLEGSSPRHQFFLRSEWSINRQTDFDAWIRYVDGLPAANAGSYTSLNLRLAWRPRPDVQLSLVGQNLLDNRHPEFSPEFISTSPTEVQRAVHATLNLSF